jgi:hypothetical protein
MRENKGDKWTSKHWSTHLGLFVNMTEYVQFYRLTKVRVLSHNCVEHIVEDYRHAES